MRVLFLRRVTASTFALTILIAAQTAVGGEPVRQSPRAGFEVVDLFTAIERDQIDATVVAPDSTRAFVQVRNTTDRPLAIRLPAALGARPVLAQFAPPGGGFPGGGAFPGGGGGGGGILGGNPGGGAGGGGQGVGFGMGPGGGGPGLGGPGLGGPGGGRPGGGPAGGFFNILPMKTIKQSVVAVCLEHGKPDPHRKMKYELVPVEELASEREIVPLLQLLAGKRVSQTVAQLAAWNVANGKSWSELARTERISVNGRRGYRFTGEQIESAKKLTQHLREQLKRASSRTGSLAQSSAGD